MHAHGLTTTGLGSPRGAVGQLLAIQAQNASDAAWSIGLRVQGATSVGVAQEIARGSIIRTWTMRGTLHLVLPKDIRWMLSLLAPRAYAARAKIWRDADLTDQIFERAREIALNNLSGHRSLTRSALIGTFNEGGIAVSGERSSHIIRYLAETQTIVPGPPSGHTQTFILFDEWIPKSADVSREESLRLLGLRYIRGHGPATVRDLAWWSGLTTSDAGRALQLAAGDLETIETGGEKYFMTSETLDHMYPSEFEQRHGIHLIPGFDEYHIGYANRRLILDDSQKAMVGPAKNGLFKSPVLHDGVVQGTWAKTIHGQQLTIEIAPFAMQAELPHSLFEPASSQYAKFISRPVAIGFP